MPRRALYAILIAIGIAVGLLLADAFPTMPAPVAPLCGDTDAEIAHVRALVQQGLEQGLQEQIAHLQTIWVQDDVSQSHRAAAGTRNAVRAFLHAQREIEQWTIPICGSK